MLKTLPHVCLPGIDSCKHLDQRPAPLDAASSSSSAQFVPVLQASRVLVSMWLTIVLLLFTAPLLPTQALQRLAIVRPFAPKDQSQLLTSFDLWNMYLPCSTGDAAPKVEVDLYLCFSQTMSSNPTAEATVQALVTEFHAQSQPWHSCFDNVYGVSTRLLPSEDRYITSADNGTRSAQGPNLQFLRIVQNLLAGTWDRSGYDTLVLMEMDTKPIRRGWLSATLEELDRNAPFVVYGSNYRGSRWDAFYADMSLPVRHHINGNAAYNLTSPDLLTLLDRFSCARILRRAKWRWTKFVWLCGFSKAIAPPPPQTGSGYASGLTPRTPSKRLLAPSKLHSLCKPER